jgi:hypothetical protein
MTDNARKTGPAVEAHFQFLMWLVPAVEKFPRTQKSTEPPRGQPQQEHHRQPEQQPRFPVGQNVFRQSRRDHGPGGRALNVQGRS